MTWGIIIFIVFTGIILQKEFRKQDERINDLYIRIFELENKE